MVKDKQFYKQILALSLPAAFQSALSLLVVMADNVMVTRTGAYALSAVAQSNAITTFVTAGLNGLATGAVVLISQYWGKRDMKRIKTICSVAAAACLLFAVLCIIAVRLFPRSLLRLVINAGETQVIDLAMQYLPIVAFSYLPYALTAAMVGMLKGVEVVRVTLYAALLSLISNVIFNYILIFGRFGAPELGVVGAAIGTLAARTLECGIVCVYVFCRDRKLQLRAAELGRSDPALRGDYFRTSVPIVLQAAMWGVLNAIQTAILGHMTASAVAAYSISSTAFLLLKVTSVGACTAASIMVGKQIGSGGKQLRTMVYTMQLLFVGLGAALGIVLFFLRIPLLRVYRISDETRYLANAFFLIQSVVLLTMSYQMPTNAGILRGGGDTRFALVLDLISFWAIVIPLSYLAAFRWHASPIVVVMLLNSDQVFKCIPAFLRVNHFRWVHSLTREA